MKDPIKIIHKFKNLNRKVQYIVYIYLGSLVPENILEILEFIKSKDLYVTLNTITKKDYNELEKYYGIYWYRYFYISYHINNQIINIESTKNKKESLINKYGNEWYINHIKNVEKQKVPYSYASSYYNYLLANNKIKNLNVKKKELDFRTYENNNDNLLGGADDDDDDKEIEIIDETILDEQIEEDININELEKLYALTENNKTVKETAKLISEAINDKKWEKKMNENDNKYDNSNDNILYDTNLENVYNKYYILNQYIYKDDTIKTIKNKISISLPLSDKYGENIYLLPETQYLWTEYIFNNKYDYVMIGHKWIKRTELLNIDIKPNDNLKIYEKLQYNLSYLKNSFGYKIKRENDETNILRYYNDFITMNEIFLLDIYNELGLNYNASLEHKQNLYDVYVNIYFPLISYDRLERIIELLNKVNIKELEYIEVQHAQIKNDAKLENEIELTVEETKLKINKYDNLFSNNYIILSIINLNIQNKDNMTGYINNPYKFNLYRIFDNFEVNEKYPFIQYQISDGQVVYKIYTKQEKLINQENYLKWFENTPYGISFKLKINDDKFLSINLFDTGRIEYKVTWKEDDEATIENIKETFKDIKSLINKINNENKKIKIIEPTDEKFVYVFINTIFKFSIPDKFKINHNDLSDFSRYFFPYISVVIEPRKRLSKKGEENVSSKYGTYLRYKRINKYDNRNKIHLRILYFLRNYDITDKELVNEIAKQFNITNNVVVQELELVKEKYSKIISRTSKKIKKLDKLPKSKPPGIGIDIQGREKEKYKVRITGAKDKEQLEEIISFIKVLIYLYVETYLYKKSSYQKLKDILLKLTNIAKRRNKVIDIVDYDDTAKNIKLLTALDKDRLAFRPEKGQNQWSRSCQNSGNKIRQPEIIADNQTDLLIKNGYKLNNKTGYYEKAVEIKIKGKMHQTVLRAAKLPTKDNAYNYYTCNPANNNEYMYIGFLARGNNPNDLCMPCCFKKNQMETVNKEKKKYFLKCLGNNNNLTELQDVSTNILTDKLYILQETNKIQDGRFIYLPKYLDIFFNKLWNNTNKIKNHYLYESNTGYYFKYTIKHEYFYFLSVIAHIYEISIETIINKIIKFLENDSTNNYYTYLNNGDIATTFKTKEEYINYIKNTNYLEYEIIGELISIPNMISSKGIIFFIINKETYTKQSVLEKDKIKTKYYLDCLNMENYYQLNYDYDIIILIKDEKYYFPIYKVVKTSKDKKIKLEKYYSINDNNFKNVINELLKYHNNSCQNQIINKINLNLNLVAKNIIYKLLNTSYKIEKQYIDERNKCKYLELSNKLIIPTKPSGINYLYPIDLTYNIINKLDYKTTLKLLNELENILNLDYKPKAIYYDQKNQNKINIVSILLENNLIILIQNEFVSEEEIKTLALGIIFQPLEEAVNLEIINYKSGLDYDKKTQEINEYNYYNESYNLYRLELSLYLNDNSEIKDKIIKIVRNKELLKDNKKKKLRLILYDIIDSKISEEYKLLIKSEDKINNKNKLGEIVNEIPNLKDYLINNIRDYCKVNINKTKCEINKHCIWSNNNCKFQIYKNYIIDFVNKIIEEMILDDVKFKEIIQELEYFVSDIVNYSQYSIKENQKIIKTSNFNLNKLMSELFGKDKIPIIGKRLLGKRKSVNIENEFIELIQQGNMYIQEVIPNKDSIIRAYVNSYYWINNPLYDIESRNLKYISELQSNITYIFKANIIDFITNNLIKTNKNNKIYNFLKKRFKNANNYFESTLHKFRKNLFNTTCIIELYVLSHIIKIPIIVYDNYLNIKYIFFEGVVPINDETTKNYLSKEKVIYIKLDYDNTNIPKKIYSIYKI